MTQPGFSLNTLDRSDRVRHEPALLQAAQQDPTARLLVLDGLDPRLDERDRLVWVPLDQAERPLLFLGYYEESPCFAQLLPAGERPPATRSPALFDMLTRFTAEDAGLYAAARSLVDWHARTNFCAVCGTASEVMHAGWGRKCPSCGSEHFPRVEPVVIMLAEHAGQLLLGRQPMFPPGRYSALAGFLEVGESIEGAVARELLEESGVKVRDIRYIASQPWPFPSSLMIACIGVADDPTIRVDPHELEDARWFSRDQVAAALARDPDAGFVAPPAYAIAHDLMRAWIDGK